MIDARAFLVAMIDAIEADPALADRVRRVLGAPAVEDVVPVAEAARIAGVRPRVLMDEQRRGRLELVGSRGRWRVRRDALVAWMTARKPKPKTPVANDTTTDAKAEARATVEATAARIAGRNGRGPHGVDMIAGCPLRPRGDAE